jgi:hypothetical protein
VKFATGSIAAADAVGARVGGVGGNELASAAHQAFTTAMSTGMRVAAAVALAGAVGSYVLLRRQSAPAVVTTALSDRTIATGAERTLVPVPAA